MKKKMIDWLTKGLEKPANLTIGFKEIPGKYSMDMSILSSSGERRSIRVAYFSEEASRYINQSKKRIEARLEKSNA